MKRFNCRARSGGWGFEVVGFQVDGKMAAAHLVQEGVDIEEFLGGPNAGARAQLQDLLNPNGHAHGRAGVEIIVIQGMRVSDDAGGDATSLAIFCAVTDREMEFVALLRGDAVAVALNIAIDDGLQEIERLDGDTLDCDGFVVGTESSFDEADPGFVIAVR